MSEPKALIRPDRGEDAIAIHLVNKDGFEAFAKGLSAAQRASLAAQKFEGGGYQYAIVSEGDSWFVVSGVANPENLSSWCLAKLAEELPRPIPLHPLQERRQGPRTARAADRTGRPDRRLSR
jgi:leucyl aminopeptidase